MTLTLTRRRAIGLAALRLAGQLLLIAAIPLALWKLSGNPIPAHLATWDQIQEQWRGIEQQPAQITYFVLPAAADVLWIAWAWYTLWTAVAYLWVLLHLPRTVLPGALAVITPAVALRALSIGALASSPGLAAHSAIAPAVPAAAAPARSAPAASIQLQAACTPVAVHVVEPGDNLWDLAAHYYHQPEDWHRIYQANKAIVQHDGRSLQDPDLIFPGWRLTIPGVSAPPAAPDAARPAPTRAPGPAAPRPAGTAPHRADGPHTVGYELPHNAGYIGITLITAVAAAVAILRTRNRRRGRPPDDAIPDLALRLAAVHSAARSAAAYSWRPDEHPGETPPPLYEPTEGQPILATTPDGRHEIPYDPETLPGPLVLTGPGAKDAARHLALSTLATGTRTLRIDPELADALLGNTPDQPVGAEDAEAGSVTIRTPRPESEDEPGTVVLDQPEHEQATADIKNDATLRAAATTGTEPDRYTGARLHTLSRDAAADLHHTLETAKPAPPQTPAENATPHSATGHARAPADTAVDELDTSQDPRTLTTVPIILRVLGHPDILGPTGEPTPVGAEQAASLLTLLALNPDGIHTHALRAMEWPDTPDGRRARVTLATAVNRIRATLRTALPEGPTADNPVLHDKSRQIYRLNPAVVTTDLALARNLTERASRATKTEEKLRLLSRAAPLYRGELAPSLDDRHRDWLTTARYTMLKESIAFHLRIADLTAKTQSDTAASHLNIAVTTAPEDSETVIAALRICRRIEQPELAQTIHRKHVAALQPIHEPPDQATEELLQEIVGRHPSAPTSPTSPPTPPPS